MFCKNCFASPRCTLLLQSHLYNWFDGGSALLQKFNLTKFFRLLFLRVFVRRFASMAVVMRLVMWSLCAPVKLYFQKMRAKRSTSWVRLRVFSLSLSQQVVDVWFAISCRWPGIVCNSTSSDGVLVRNHLRRPSGWSRPAPKFLSTLFHLSTNHACVQ